MKRLVFLGDSITDCNHYFDPENLGNGYIRMISEKINTPDENYQVLNNGNDGFTVPALQRLWNRIGSNLQPDHISILIGINDLAVIKNTGITPSIGLARFREQYETLIREIRTIANCPILLMEPFIFPSPAEYYLWEPELETISTIIQNIAEENNLSFLPLWKTLSTAAKEQGISALTTDGIHLTPYGHSILAEQWIQSALQFPL